MDGALPARADRSRVAGKGTAVKNQFDIERLSSNNKQNGIAGASGAMLSSAGKSRGLGPGQNGFGRAREL